MVSSLCHPEKKGALSLPIRGHSGNIMLPFKTGCQPPTVESRGPMHSAGGMRPRPGASRDAEKACATGRSCIPSDEVRPTTRRTAFPQVPPPNKNQHNGDDARKTAWRNKMNGSRQSRRMMLPRDWQRSVNGKNTRGSCDGNPQNAVDRLPFPEANCDQGRKPT
jgi:hypothetical protein